MDEIARRPLHRALHTPDRHPEAAERSEALEGCCAAAGDPSRAASRPPQGEGVCAKPLHRKARNDFSWEGVERLPYKEDDRALFRTITRQVLFSDPALAAELRYFEMAPGGFSTLERHEHVHAVLILRGRGHCLIGEEVRVVEPNDLVSVPAWTWHQFRATRGEPLGFLCMVNARRDKPQLPSPADLARLAANAEVAAFLRGTPG
jgi:mannose-6-phosphate isomerase-like protein (cupin superfamily)